ncbi:MAG: adenylate/guanylate cyclase domain-containing protein [Desulfococcaceae bacterium]|jgi:class 3 adenylate cyclase/HAMP domain-containing protein|nr:adenylate/guanylate cyclase domain-containing protein [Desulfococcaceae bacterium]
MLKKYRLGTRLNISFGLVLFVPMIITTVFSIVYYSNKIEQEAVNKINSDLKIAELIYQNALEEMKSLANAYSQKKEIIMLLGYNVGEKIGRELSKSAQGDQIDMITVTDNANTVLVRSHAPEKINQPYLDKNYTAKALSGKSFSFTEILHIGELEEEGLTKDLRIFLKDASAFTLTGIAPVYDRQKSYITGTIIVRRILNNKADSVQHISRYLSVSAALTMKDQLILTSGTPSDAEEQRNFIPPPVDLARKLEENRSFHVKDMRRGGSITAGVPVRDYHGKPAGILMVQNGVASYLRTRNIAVVTLLGIFVVGFILAFSIKTIIGRDIVIPVQKLREEAEKIRAGEYGHTLEFHSGDEIGELTESFNTMSQELQQYDRQIREHNLQLEERVRERTAELQIANQQLVSANTALEDTLEKLNPGVSKLIGHNKQQLGLVYATEMVADVCNYTKLNMILGETLMGEFMKKFFRESHKLLAQYKGMFDKTVGDQIVAIFGMPKDHSPASPMHPFDAVACSLNLIKAAQVINAEMQSAIQDNYTSIITRHNSLSDEDRRNIRIEELRFQCRVGINTSDPDSSREIDRMRMVMMGAETYVDYTAQGGAVIYAFRLESNGKPGHIHIGENTKRLVSHVYKLEDLPPITLKGLGIQSGYRVVGYQCVFENIYPKTMIYKLYCNKPPAILTFLMNNICVGKIQIREVIKIKEYLDVDIRYLEHMAGVYNLCMARAVIAYAAARYLDMDEENLNALLFASIWHNISALIPDSESFIMSDPKTQIPENINGNLVEKILSEMENPAAGINGADIIRLANFLDYKMFDRTCLQTRNRDVISAKEAITLIKLEGKSAPEILSAFESLIIAGENSESAETQEDTPPAFPAELPGEPEQLAKIIMETFSPEQQKELLAKLCPADVQGLQNPLHPGESQQIEKLP